MNGGLSLILHSNTTDYLSTLGNNFVDEGFAIRLLYDHFETGSFISIAPGFHSWIGMQVMEKTVSHGMIPSVFNPPCTDNPYLTILDNKCIQYFSSFSPQCYVPSLVRPPKSLSEKV